MRLPPPTSSAIGFTRPFDFGISSTARRVGIVLHRFHELHELERVIVIRMWDRPFRNLGMTPGPSPFIHSFSHLLAVLAFRGFFSRSTRYKPDPPSNFLLSSPVRDVSEGFCVVVPTRSQKRTRNGLVSDSEGEIGRSLWNKQAIDSLI